MKIRETIDLNTYYPYYDIVDGYFTYTLQTQVLCLHMHASYVTVGMNWETKLTIITRR